ncbi:MAG TPA: hypothetical protein VG796_28690 [Verrucomicrobiales bacterium]|jgi:hypothetical protein|nr:hypothetical protein [Verrucomicrobiales bacterium]
MPDGWLAWRAAGAASAGLPEIPSGWKLVAEGKLAGVHLIMPFRLAAEDGAEAVTIQSSGFYVDPRWHGPASGALFLSLVRLRSRFHCSVSTANHAASAVWKAFRAQPEPGSEMERCLMTPRFSLLEEAVVRPLPPLGKLLRKFFPRRPALERKLAALRSGFGAAVAASGLEAVKPASELPWHGAGAVPSEALLRWRLSSPAPWQELLILQTDGGVCAVYFTASARGHRGQIAAVDISAVWGSAWDEDPSGVISMIIAAARRHFTLVTLGFSPVPLSVQQLFRQRALDAPRRWWATSPAQPLPLPGWNGLNSL